MSRVRFPKKMFGVAFANGGMRITVPQGADHVITSPRREGQMPSRVALA